MDFITVNEENIEREHICCSIVDKKGENGVALKKEWLKQRFADGLVFRRLDARAKVFIEYIPADKCWYPIEADGYMHINCFWVSGQYKGHGYANQLLEYCIADAKAKNMKGLTVIASEKKRSFLSDAGYMKHKGFVAADTADPFYVLYYLPFTDSAEVPKFKECAKRAAIDEKGMVIYYTNQCPFTGKYVEVVAQLAAQHGLPLKIHKIETTEQAQNMPCAITTYGFFYEGKFVTNEVMGDKKFEQFIKEKSLV